MNAQAAVFVAVVGSVSLLGCGGGGAAPATPERRPVTSQSEAPTPEHGTTTTLVENGTAVPNASNETADAETAEQIFARVRADLVTCYEQGRKSVPTMTSGKITLNTSIDRSGKATCVVPSDDTGLTQEVEDCMRTRMGREAFKTSTGSWAAELPIVVKEAKVSLGPPAAAAPAIETVETHGLPDSAHEVVEGLLPKLHQCTQETSGSSSLRVVHVGARVGKDGRVECALASSPSPIPSKMRECAASVLATATFPSPKSSVGLVSVPVKVLARK